MWLILLSAVGHALKISYNITEQAKKVGEIFIPVNFSNKSTVGHCTAVCFKFTYNQFQHNFHKFLNSLVRIFFSWLLLKKKYLVLIVQNLT